MIQRVLRHANVGTTNTYYIKTVAGDVRDAMDKLQGVIDGSSDGSDTLRTSKEQTTVM